MRRLSMMLTLLSVLLLRVASGQAATLLFSEGYESGDIDTNWTLSSPTTIEVCTDDPHTGTYSACIDYTGQSGNAEHGSGSWGGTNGNVDGYVSFWARFPSGWTLSDENGQGHWWRLQGVCWQFDVVFDAESGGQVRTEIRIYDTGGGGCTGSAYNEYTFGFDSILDDQYHHFEWLWHRNTSGQANGYIHTWKDGTPWQNFDNIQLVPSTNDANFANYRLLFPSNTGGSTSGGMSYWDDLEIWTGCPTTLTFGGGTPACAAGADTTPPNPPTNLQATTISASRIDLTWTAGSDPGGSGISHYLLYWCNSGASCTPATPINVGNVTSYSHTSLTPGTLYRYQLSAMDAAGNESTKDPSTCCEEATTSADATVPALSAGAPSGTLAFGTTSTQIRLTATDATPPITCHYDTTDIAYASMANTMGTSGCSGGSTHCATVSGLTNGGSYTYYVRCQDSVSPTPNTNTTSLTISFDVSDANIPATPTNLTVTATATMSLTLGWDTSSGATGYRLYECHTSVSCTPTVELVDQAGLTYSHLKLVPGTLYRYRVSAYNGTGESAASSVVTGTTSQVGIANSYPLDSGIGSDGRVVWVEAFEGSVPTHAACSSSAGYNDGLQTSNITLDADTPTNSGGSTSARYTTPGADQNVFLYKNFGTTSYTQWFLRYYVKYLGGSYHHAGFWTGGYNTPENCPFPRAGDQPTGADTFWGGFEPSNSTTLDTYLQYHNMHPDGLGDYWGNEILNDAGLTVPEDVWISVEIMYKLNDPVTASNGEFAVWIDGTKIGHWGEGFPTGSWSGGNFTTGAGTTPFEGFEFRTDSALTLNHLWLQMQGFATNTAVLFDDVVLSTEYIGPIAAAGAGQTVSLSSSTPTIATTPGQSVSVTITATLDSGDAAELTFSTSTLPSGTTASWTPAATCTPTPSTCQVSVAFQTTGGGSPTPAGLTLVTITGTDGTINPTTTVNLVVVDATGTAEVRYPVADTFLNINTTNYSTDPQLALYTYPANASANTILMTFDLSDLIDAGDLESATLFLYLVDADGTADPLYAVPSHAIINVTPVLSQATGSVYATGSPWTGGTDALGLQDIAAATTTVNINKTLGWKTWALDSLIAVWIANPTNNRGLLLNSDISLGANRYRSFASSEAVTSTDRPFLVLTFDETVTDTTPPAAPTNLRVTYP